MIWFSVNLMAAISVKVEMMEAGIATAAISVVRMLARKMKMMTAARRLPSIRCDSIASTAVLMKID